MTFWQGFVLGSVVQWTYLTVLSVKYGWWRR